MLKKSKQTQKIIPKICAQLLQKYGPQGWWPLLELGEQDTAGKTKGCNPTKTGSIKGYHPGDYSYPKTKEQRFEICIGAILTQNTAWPNVEKALQNLQAKNALSPEAILKLSDSELCNAIKPAGYYNQKAKKLRIFSEFYISLRGRTPTREELLSLWGIGKETADSILLYAYKVPSFVIDTYTKRILTQLRLARPNEDYDTIKTMFESSIKKNYKLYQEYHALLVEHAKRHYAGKEKGAKKSAKKEKGNGCSLKELLKEIQ